MEQHTMIMADSGNVANGVDSTDLIVGIHHGDDSSFIANRFFNDIGFDQAILI